MFERMPEAVRDAVDVEVAIGAALVVADLLPHPLGEDLRAAAGQRIEARVLELDEHLLVGHAVEIREERDLDGGEALEMNARTDPLEAAQQLQVVVERQIGMQAVDDVDFGQRLMGALPQLVPRLFERHRVRPVVAGLQPREGAEQAAGDADVGRFEPDVEVVVGARAVPLLALAIRQPAERQRVRTVEQPHAVVEGEAHAGLELVVDVGEAERCEAARALELRDTLHLNADRAARAVRRARPRARAATGRARVRRR